MACWMAAITRAVAAGAVKIERAQVDEAYARRDSDIVSAGEVAVAADDSGDVGAVTVEVVLCSAGVRGRGAGEILVIDHARMRLGRIPQIRMTVVNAAVDHGHADARAVVAGVPGGGHARRHVRGVIQFLHGMVNGYGENFGVGFQSSQCADRNRESDRP